MLTQSCGLHTYFPKTNSETWLTASVQLNQDPNAQTVNRNANYNGTTPKVCIFSGVTFWVKLPPPPPPPPHTHTHTPFFFFFSFQSNKTTVERSKISKTVSLSGYGFVCWWNACGIWKNTGTRVNLINHWGALGGGGGLERLRRGYYKHHYLVLHRPTSELRSCVKVEVAVLGRPR